MNHIKEIEIKNFKSLRHQTIEDCRRVNVFIGYPNVGKSNILEALSVFSINEASINFSPFVRMEDLTTIFFNGDISRLAEIYLNNKYRLAIRFENDALAFISQVGREETSFEKVDTKNILNKKNFIVDNNKSILNYKLFFTEKERELPEIRKYEFVKHFQYSNKGYASLSYPNGNNIFNIISTNSILKKEVGELFKSYDLELLYDTRLQKFEILKRTISGIFTIPYSMIADTLQRLIFYKAAILSNKEKVLLFEEPEAHMFPPYISKVTSDIIHDENNNQYFLATHSPFVMNDLIANTEKDELAIYIVSYENETGETLIHRMNVEDVDEAYQFGYDFFMNINNFIPQKQHD